MIKIKSQKRCVIKILHPHVAIFKSQETEYIIKIFSSISPAYEETIDELMLSHGTDTITIFMKFSWLPKFPVTYIQKYYNILTAPNNGPLSDVRTNVKKQLK